MKKPIPTALACALLVTGAAWAADAAQPAAQAASAAVPTTLGEVRKVDKENQKVTLKHGEIKNLGMPAMTMVFKAKDAGMLDKLQPGDKVRFSADKMNGVFVITAIETE